MATAESHGMALLENALIANSIDAPSQATVHASEVEKIVIRSLRKLVYLFSDTDGQAGRCDAVGDDGGMGIVDVRSTDDSVDAPADSGDEPGEDTTQGSSTESIEDPDVDPTVLFRARLTTPSPIERLQNELAASFQAIIPNEVRKALQANDCIQRESRLLGEPLVDDHKIKLRLSPEGYQEWLEQHQAAIGTRFTFIKGSYKFISKKRAGDQHIYLQCQRAGVKCERKNRIKGGKSGKPRVRISTMKIGCPSKITVVTQKRPASDGSMQNVYDVTYLYQHNHGVGCFSSVGTQQTTSAIKATIKDLILGGSTISTIMRQLTMEHDQFTQIVRSQDRFTGDNFITFGDIYNIWHSAMASKMRKDDDLVISSVKWMEELERDGTFTYYNRNDPAGGQYFGFSTTWQMDQLKTSGQTICFDRTCNVFGQNMNLFTLVVRNAHTGFGVPAAFLLTNTTESPVIVGWLNALQSRMTALFSSPGQVYKYKPRVVITDQGDMEILAIRRAFAEDNVSIFFCAWHVNRVWEREVPKRIRGIAHYPLERRNSIEARVISELRSILKESDSPKALQSILQFRERWSEQHDLLQFLDNNYFGSAQDENAARVQKHWMTCYRQGVPYSLIDTSYIESWHNVLERHFFKDRQQMGPDTLIYILACMVVPHFQQKCNRSVLEAGRMTTEENIEERYRSTAVKHLEVRESVGFEGDPIVQVDGSTLRVESFTTPDTFYNIHIDLTNAGTSEITSCSCRYFFGCCKHVALVMLLKPQMRLKRVESDLQGNRSDNKRCAPDDEQNEHMEYLDIADDHMPERESTYLQRINEMESLKDKDTPWRNQEAIDNCLAQAIRLMEEEVNVDTIKRRKQ